MKKGRRWLSYETKAAIQIVALWVMYTIVVVMVTLEAAS